MPASHRAVPALCGTAKTGAVVCGGPRGRSNHVLGPGISVWGQTPALLLAQPLPEAWIYADLRAEAGDDRAAESALVEPLLPKLRPISWQHDLQPARAKQDPDKDKPTYEPPAMNQC